MHLHILGICGTFMGGIAALAQAAGHRVTGSDAAVYPPMSDQLAALGIAIHEGYGPAALDPAPDLVVVGNVVSRGNPAMEYVLDRGIPYTSGPQWLAEHLLPGKWVLAVAGTHGKTTTSSILAHVLEQAGLAPGFLIGGVPSNFGISARAGAGSFFVIEADEYDTAFFDKRAKFVHYRPRTAVLNNLEYDHADIYPDLAAICRQFHHLVRTVPGNGQILCPDGDAALDATLAMGCWSDLVRFDATGAAGDDSRWRLQAEAPDFSEFLVQPPAGEAVLPARVSWSQFGAHNAANAMAALLAARHAGVPLAQGAQALTSFAGVRRRLELRGEVGGIAVYDDFAHHPTAIAAAIDGLRRRRPADRLIALLDLRSNSMRAGAHQAGLADALAAADTVFVHAPASLAWDVATVLAPLGGKLRLAADVEGLLALARPALRPGDAVLAMSNGGFGGIHQRLLDALGTSAREAHA